MGEKPCKLCSGKRYANLTICYKHYLENERRKRAEKKAKALIRKHSTKKYQESERKKLKRKLDLLWPVAVKNLAKWTCELCGNSDPNTRKNAHHLIRRSKSITRWDVKNGVCLCGMKCHKNGIHIDTVMADRLMTILRERRGEDWYSEMLRKSETIWKPTMEELLEIEKELTELI